jgi:hypothetical protein
MQKRKEVRDMKLKYASLLAIPGVFVLGTAQGWVASAQLKAVLPGHGMSEAPVATNAVSVKGNTVRFIYQNVSEQDVESVLFEAAYRDDAQQLHRIEVQGGYQDEVHPGLYRTGELEVPGLRRVHAKEVVLWPVHVMYKGGTVWDMPPK